MTAPAASKNSTAKIGPGRLVLVVGPSGAGKDTVIGLAKTMLVEDARVVFPRRIVTRPSSASEDHDTLAADAFDTAAANGMFAFWWRAHGHGYGIPRAIEDDIARGDTVVCNVSRAVIDDVRARFADVAVVAITASPDIIAARLTARGRDSDGPIGDRIARNAAYKDMTADVVVDNSTTPDAAANAFVAVIRAGSQKPPVRA